MNNRELSPKIREKRSYEFLMGLINNNSRFEVTRVDPSPVTEKPKVINENQLAASDILLELMVRIASHPQQWEKVHQLLQKLDRDLTTSKNIVDKLQTGNGLENFKIKDIYVNKKKLLHSAEDISSFSEEQETSEVFDRRKNKTKNFNPVYDKELQWPNFDSQDSENHVKFVNNSKNAGGNVTNSQKYQSQAQNRSAKVAYPKNFAYHRVTGKPIYLNKTPTAYIAVSVIAPKPSSEETKEDINLENELHRLKPWTRPNDFKDVATASFGPRWATHSGRNP